tara:strand:+ start:133 stop:306 length:174 start_codon:yes stop_codon:yes gene_type:complete
MSKKKQLKKTNLQKVAKVSNKQHTEKNKNLIIGGVLLAMSSIGLLIFVISEKLFHLS